MQLEIPCIFLMKEREQLLEPKESVSALKIRERVRSKKEGEEDRSWKD